MEGNDYVWFALQGAKLSGRHTQVLFIATSTPNSYLDILIRANFYFLVTLFGKRILCIGPV
jgi:hypothetical protein